MSRTIRVILAALCAALAVFFLLPLAAGLHHIGMFYPAALLLLYGWMLLRPQKVKKLLNGRSRGVFRTAAALLAAGTAVILAVLCAMGVQSARRPTDSTPRTVVVLGCEVRGTRPGRMLSDRIDSAYRYLSRHPEAVCVASGGMADDEIITEASCIRAELIARGIAPERIYVEDQSESTAENLAFSARVIRENGLPTDIAVASDNFHQLRAAIYARKNGLQAQSLGCRSYWLLSAGYWAREVPAIAAALLRGY